MREVLCKDCLREVESKARAPEDVSFRYNETWAEGILERGGSRSDRCREHRRKHRVNTQGLAVAYIDLETVGEVADRENPTGPLGGLGPLPDAHVPRPGAARSGAVRLRHERRPRPRDARQAQRPGAAGADPQGRHRHRQVHVRALPADGPAGGRLVPTCRPRPDRRHRAAGPGRDRRRRHSSAGRCPAPAGSDPATRSATRCPATATTTTPASSSTSPTGR